MTVVAGAKTVDLKVAGNTHLKGAVVGVEGGEVRLDTGTFTYEDLRDYDRSKNLSLNVNLSYSWMGESADGAQAPGKGGQQQAAAPANADSWHKNIPVKVEGSYEEKNKEGVTRATVGAGTVAARDEAKQKQLEDGGKTGKLAAVNRDLSKTQEVTKDERKYAKIYASDTAVKEAVKAVRYAGEKLSDFVSAVIGKMDAPEEMSGEQKERLRRLAKAYMEDAEARRQILQCATQQTYDFNPLRLFIGTAYAANACAIPVAGGVETIAAGEAEVLAGILRAIAVKGLEGLEIAAGGVAAAPAMALAFLIVSTTSTAGPQKQTIELANGVTLELTINNDTGSHSAQFTMADGSRTVIDFRNNSQWYEIAGAYQILADGSQMDLPRDEIGRAADAVASATGYKLKQEKGVVPGAVLSENSGEEGGDKGTPIGYRADGTPIYRNDNGGPEDPLPIVPPFLPSDQNESSGTPAGNSASGVKLNSQLLAEEVANGHAFDKHVVEGGEFQSLNIRTRAQFQDFIEKIVSDPAIERRYAADGTAYYLDQSTHTVVIRGQRGEATAFRPDYGVGWNNYLNSQVPRNTNPPGHDPASSGR